MVLEHSVEKSHTKRVAGETATSSTVTVAAADLTALASGLSLAQLLLTECFAQHIHLFTTNALSISRDLNQRPHSGRRFALETCSTLNSLPSVHSTLTAEIMWYLILVASLPFAVANLLPLPPLPARCLPIFGTLSHQCLMSRDEAIALWQQHWYSSTRHSTVYLAAYWHSPHR